MHEEITRIRKADKEKCGEIENDINTIKSRQIDKIEKEYGDYIDKVRKLQDQKIKLLQSTRSKAEMFEYAKESLRRGRQYVLEAYLKKHLENHRPFSLPNDPFGERGLRSLFNEEKSWRLGVFAITDEDIKAAIDMLPDTGISIVEREAQIKEADKEIARLHESTKGKAAKKN